MIPTGLKAICVTLALASPATADWVALDDAAIAAVLTDVEIVYDAGPTQRFYASGRTFYDNGRPSWGDWQARAGQYCSQWPPSDHWACYDFFEDETGAVRFVGSAGDEYIGRQVAE